MGPLDSVVGRPTTLRVQHRYQFRVSRSLLQVWCAEETLAECDDGCTFGYVTRFSYVVRYQAHNII